VNREWDAATYDRVSDPQVAMARQVLDRLDLNGDETVLDAGCGSGRTTAMLLERLPRGHVVAVDQSEAMVDHAREALGEGATVIQAELTELELASRVDAVFSNAVFHWIADHPRLVARLHAALRPGGRLVAQCGGEGNVARFHAAAAEVSAEPPYAQHLRGWRGPWNFAGPAQTAQRLEDAGFTEVETWLQPYPVSPDDPVNYLRTVCLGYLPRAAPRETAPRLRGRSPGALRARARLRAAEHRGAGGTLRRVKKTSIYLEPELDRAMARLAERDGITKAEAIRRALARAIEGSPRPRITAIGVGFGPGDVADDVDRHLAQTGFGDS
jgi:trans-aconitate 2-methyltransferase